MKSQYKVNCTGAGIALLFKAIIQTSLHLQLKNKSGRANMENEVRIKDIEISREMCILHHTNIKIIFLIA